MKKVRSIYYWYINLLLLWEIRKKIGIDVFEWVCVRAHVDVHEPIHTHAHTYTD